MVGKTALNKERYHLNGGPFQTFKERYHLNGGPFQTLAKTYQNETNRIILEHIILLYLCTFV